MKKLLLILILVLVAFPVWAASYRAVDKRAENVPFKDSESLPKLVAYLTKPYQNNEENKARVLMAWIVYHIDYDAYKADKSQRSVSSRRRRSNISSNGDIFETRLGTCSDIAHLYQRMAGLAGLDSVVVTGYAGTNVTMRNKEENRHAWNVVKINGNWEFVDATWAMRGDYKVLGDVGTKGRYTREVEKRKANQAKTAKTRKNRTIDDRWFMTKPSEMIKTHFPDDQSWQLLPVPKSMGSFLK